jgi:ubiquinone/menaquinone biosynthesis C-methylase UbiE
MWPDSPVETAGGREMKEVVDLARYDLFGWDYESVNALTETEVQWHLTWARRTGGPVLALACGTGRLLCRLAEAGFETVGLDLSDTMLALARRNADTLASEARSRLQFVKANMTYFDLKRRFGMVMIADNSFREQKTRRDLHSCLRCIRRHLLPGGRLLVTERRFNPALFPDGRRAFGWSEPRPHPQTGEMVCRRGEIRLSKDHRRIRGKFVYKTAREDGSETVEECPWSGPILQKQEYVELFARAGFTARVCSGYQEIEDEGRDPILCFVCEVSRD